MRKQTHFKKVVSFALAAAMAVSVCTAALADEATTEATKEAAASEQVETQSDGETKDKAVMLTGEPTRRMRMLLMLIVTPARPTQPCKMLSLTRRIRSFLRAM